MSRPADKTNHTLQHLWNKPQRQPPTQTTTDAIVGDSKRSSEALEESQWPKRLRECTPVAERQEEALPLGQNTVPTVQSTAATKSPTTLTTTNVAEVVDLTVPKPVPSQPSTSQQKPSVSRGSSGSVIVDCEVQQLPANLQAFNSWLFKWDDRLWCKFCLLHENRARTTKQTDFSKAGANPKPGNAVNTCNKHVKTECHKQACQLQSQSNTLASSQSAAQDRATIGIDPQINTAYFIGRLLCFNTLSLQQ